MNSFEIIGRLSVWIFLICLIIVIVYAIKKKSKKNKDRIKNPDDSWGCSSCVLKNQNDACTNCKYKVK